MKEKELIVLQLIKKNPFLSQQEMSEMLGMTRTALANIISGLINKGEIVGRAYVLANKNFIFSIGGANIDRKFHLNGYVQQGTSNPALVTESVGGVARNIAENLGRLGNTVALITLFGQDRHAKIIEEESAPFMHLNYSEIQSNLKTGSYSAVLDQNGELLLAMADMSIYDYLLPTQLEKHEAMLNKAKCIIIDLNCPKETVNYIQNLACLRSIPLILVPVSGPKMKNMPDDLIGVSYFICNKEEAETYLNMRMISDQDYMTGIKRLLEKDARNVIFYLGERGVFYGNINGIFYVEATEIPEIIDVTGASDAFVSALIHGILNDEALNNAVKFALYNSAMTMQTEKTVRLDLNKDELSNWQNNKHLF